MTEEQIKKDAEALFSQAGNAHDFLHTERVLALAERISCGIYENRSLLTAACMFHDIGRLFPEKGKNHAVISAEWSRKHLGEYGFSKEETEEAALAIETHSWSGGREPENILGMILQDSDRIDALGAVGLARMFSFAEGESLYCKDDPACESGRQPDQEKYTADHAYQKLFSIPERLHFEKSKNIAERRASFMREFFMHMKSEINGEQ